MEGKILVLATSFLMSISQVSDNNNSAYRLLKLLVGSIIIAITLGIILCLAEKYFTPFINLSLELIYGIEDNLLKL